MQQNNYFIVIETTQTTTNYLKEIEKFIQSMILIHLSDGKRYQYHLWTSSQKLKNVSSDELILSFPLKSTNEKLDTNSFFDSLNLNSLKTMKQNNLSNETKQLNECNGIILLHSIEALNQLKQIEETFSTEMKVIFINETDQQISQVDLNCSDERKQFIEIKNVKQLFLYLPLFRSIQSYSISLSFDHSNEMKQSKDSKQKEIQCQMFQLHSSSLTLQQKYLCACHFIEIENIQKPKCSVNSIRLNKKQCIPFVSLGKSVHSFQSSCYFNLYPPKTQNDNSFDLKRGEINQFITNFNENESYFNSHEMKFKIIGKISEETISLNGLSQIEGIILCNSNENDSFNSLLQMMRKSNHVLLIECENGIEMKHCILQVDYQYDLLYCISLNSLLNCFHLSSLIHSLNSVHFDQKKLNEKVEKEYEEQFNQLEEMNFNPLQFSSNSLDMKSSLIHSLLSFPILPK